MAVGRMREEKRSILICSDLQPYQVYTFHCWQLGLIIALNTPSEFSQSENSIINHNQSPPPTLYPPVEDTNNVCSHPPDGLIRQLPISSLSSGLAKDPLTLIVKWSLCDDCQRVRDAQDTENNGGDKWSTGTQWCMQRGVWWSIWASEECITEFIWDGDYCCATHLPHYSDHPWLRPSASSAHCDYISKRVQPTMTLCKSHHAEIEWSLVSDWYELSFLSDILCVVRSNVRLMIQLMNACSSLQYGGCAEDWCRGEGSGYHWHTWTKTL